MKFLTYADVGITEPENGIIEFELTKDHLKLLRGAYVIWDNTEHGAPAINPSRPYGTVDIIGDMERVLELEPLTYHPDALALLHRQTAVALQIVLKTGKYKAAKYRADKYTQNWKEYNPKLRKVKEDEREAELDVGGE